MSGDGGCIASMRNYSLDVPVEFEILEKDVLIPKDGLL
jgi:hypothetical protein